MPAPGQHRDRRVDTVDAVDQIDLAVTRAHPPLAGGDRGGHRGVEDGITVHAVAQDRIGEAAGLEQLLGAVVVDAHQRRVALIGAEIRRVRDPSYPRELRGLDRIAVLPDAVSDLVPADEQHLFGPARGRHERLRTVEVTEAHIAPELCVFRELVRLARHQDELRWVHLSEQPLEGHAAEIARSPCNQCFHGCHPVCVGMAIHTGFCVPASRRPPAEE